GHRFGGLGLGLAISRKLVELHAGRIIAESRGKDQGSTFTITLPLAGVSEAALRGGKPDKPEGAAGGSVAGAAVDVPKARTGGRILLVEDHEPTRAPLTRLLVRRGYDVVAVGSATAALEAAAAGNFDLVLSDIGLPDGDGFTLMR